MSNNSFCFASSLYHTDNYNHIYVVPTTPRLPGVEDVDDAAADSSTNSEQEVRRFSDVVSVVLLSVGLLVGMILFALKRKMATINNADQEQHHILLDDDTDLELVV